MNKEPTLKEVLTYHEKRISLLTGDQIGLNHQKKALELARELANNNDGYPVSLQLTPKQASQCIRRAAIFDSQQGIHGAYVQKGINELKELDENRRKADIEDFEEKFGKEYHHQAFPEGLKGEAFSVGPDGRGYKLPVMP